MEIEYKFRNTIIEEENTERTQGNDLVYIENGGRQGKAGEMLIGISKFW